MIILDRMALADAFTPKDLVQEIFRQCPNLKPPIPVRELAVASGILEILTVNSSVIEGMLVTDEGKEAGVIYYNDHNRPIGRQRFTIGHELGHFLLLNHNGNMTCSNTDVSLSSHSVDLIEKEANDFSQLLLLPEKLLKTELQSTSLSIQSLQAIADLFQMSFEATANKCTAISSKPFALVYSKDEKVRYCWKNHHTFPYYSALRKGSLLPRGSQALAMIPNEQTITEARETNASHWFNESSRYRLPKTIIEQTFFQNDGYKVTLLFEP
jgi:Zn-dependent peptidase ImmA (M78 family)